MPDGSIYERIHASTGSNMLGVRNSLKDELLEYMESFEAVAYAIGPFRDLKSGQYMWNVPYGVFEDGNLFWTSEDIWNLREHDLEINPAFVEAALGKR